nr:immunoglobulin light chain junction region [Macaca mulatta]
CQVYDSSANLCF